MEQALTLLAKELCVPVRLIVGGGGAMVLAHKFSLSTSHIDAVPASGMTLSEIAPAIEKVADALGLPKDWLNPYYSTFAHVLPKDYGNGLIRVFQKPPLVVDALSLEDLR